MTDKHQGPAGRPSRRGLLKAACLTPLVLPLLAACGSTGDPAPLPRLEAGPYRLDAGDKVRITVFGQEDLSDEYTLNDGGAISMPLIGEVKARGLTTGELETQLKSQLVQAGVLVNPSVSAEVETFRPFYILGEVAKPGQYPYVSGMTVLTAVAIAGGFTYRADKTGMLITRTLDGKPVEGRATRTDGVVPGDVIVIEERFF